MDCTDWNDQLCDAAEIWEYESCSRSNEKNHVTFFRATISDVTEEIPDELLDYTKISHFNVEKETDDGLLFSSIGLEYADNLSASEIPEKSLVLQILSAELAEFYNYSISVYNHTKNTISLSVPMDTSETINILPGQEKDGNPGFSLNGVAFDKENKELIQTFRPETQLDPINVRRIYKYIVIQYTNSEIICSSCGQNGVRLYSKMSHPESAPMEIKTGFICHQCDHFCGLKEPVNDLLESLPVKKDQLMKSLTNRYEESYKNDCSISYRIPQEPIKTIQHQSLNLEISLYYDDSTLCLAIGEMLSGHPRNSIYLATTTIEDLLNKKNALAIAIADSILPSHDKCPICKSETDFEQSSTTNYNGSLFHHDCVNNIQKDIKKELESHTEITQHVAADLL